MEKSTIKPISGNLIELTKLITYEVKLDKSHHLYNTLQHRATSSAKNTGVCQTINILKQRRFMVNLLQVQSIDPNVLHGICYIEETETEWKGGYPCTTLWIGNIPIQIKENYDDIKAFLLNM